jgi:5-methylcytosine-specific restriction endonuclease McrA
MKYKYGICRGCGEMNIMLVNAHYHLCYKCNRARLNEQKKLKEAVRDTKIMKKYSANVKERRKALNDADWILFNKIWGERERKCHYCGKYLGGEPKKYNFHHILFKTVFPSLRYRNKNIALVCFDCHQIAHSPHITDKMISTIIETGRYFIRIGMLLRIGEPNVNKIKEWIVEPKE